MLSTGNISVIKLLAQGTGGTSYWDDIRPYEIAPAFLFNLAGNWKNN
jgi:hypothetical protein